MDSNRRAKLLKATVCSPEHPCGKFYSNLGLFSHNPNGVYPLPPPPASFVATGNFVKTQNAQYNTILTFSGNGTFTVYSRPLGFNYIIVGCGGGGGGGSTKVDVDARVYVDDDGNWQAKVEKISDRSASKVGARIAKDLPAAVNKNNNTSPRRR